MSNPNIKQYAAAGGKARAAKLSRGDIAIIAKKGSDARIRKYGLVDRQAEKQARLANTRETYDTLLAKYTAVCYFLVSRGYDVQQVLNHAETLDEVRE